MYIYIYNIIYIYIYIHIQISLSVPMQGVIKLKSGSKNQLRTKKTLQHFFPGGVAQETRPPLLPCHELSGGQLLRPMGFLDLLEIGGREPRVFPEKTHHGLVDNMIWYKMLRCHHFITQVASTFAKWSFCHRGLFVYLRRLGLRRWDPSSARDRTSWLSCIWSFHADEGRGSLLPPRVDGVDVMKKPVRWAWGPHTLGYLMGNFMGIPFWGILCDGKTCNPEIPISSFCPLASDQKLDPPGLLCMWSVRSAASWLC